MANEKAYIVSINGREHTVVIDGNQATVDGQAYAIEVRESASPAARPQSPPPAAPRPTTRLAPIAPVAAPVESKSEAAAHPPGAVPIEAPMNGEVLEILVEVGQVVAEGDTLLILEAMKMEIEIKATVNGTVSEIAAAVGEQAKVGQMVVLLT